MRYDRHRMHEAHLFITGERPVMAARRRALGALVGLLLGGTLVACGPSEESAADRPPVSTTPIRVNTPEGSPERIARPVRPAATPQMPHPSPEPLVALATADAARHASAGPSGVRVVHVEPREWPDRSLGCPRPGMGYAQAITPGYLIVVEADGRRLEYHTDHVTVTLCGS